MNFLDRTASPGTAIPIRLFHSMWRQSALAPSCPFTPRLDGKLALVTGGNAGIGFHIATGLARRGAEVIIAARRENTAVQAATQIRVETGSQVHSVRLDLADLNALQPFLAGLATVLNGRPIDILVQNAGVWPQRYSCSPQGHEIAFATNVLGHHALTRRLLGTGNLAPGARVIIQTGDIYIMAQSCTADFNYRGAYGGMLAYCRSKLGNLWFAAGLQRRHPSLEVAIAHPGVVASGLVTVGGGVGAAIKRQTLLSPERGAQTALLLATQPGVARGAYYHNTLGRMILAANDPARDAAGAEGLWHLLERLFDAHH